MLKEQTHFHLLDDFIKLSLARLVTVYMEVSTILMLTPYRFFFQIKMAIDMNPPRKLSKRINTQSPCQTLVEVHLMAVENFISVLFPHTVRRNV